MINETIQQTIEKLLSSNGFQLVYLSIPDDQNTILQVMIEHHDDALVTINDCKRVSRLISPVLDVCDSIKGPYQLEVSSPGIERPLFKLKDYQRFIGYDIQLETIEPIETHRHFKGVIEYIEDGLIFLCLNHTRKRQQKTNQTQAKSKLKSKPMAIPFKNIKKASLRLSGKLAIETGLIKQKPFKHRPNIQPNA
ncbi:MAG: ribosome maturation factor RimP [Pseudomonadota bacterium]